MPDKGWIKLHRQLQECPMWYSERFSKGQAWVDLLLLANHSDKKILFNGEFIIVERGQYLTSMVKLAEKWKWSRPTVTNFLNLLEKDKMITRSSDNQKTLITIENYGIYQDFREDDLQPTLQPTLQESCNPINNPLYTNNNVKNDKNVKNNILNDIQSALNAWNELKTYGIKTVSKISSSSQRYQRLSARINEYGVENVLVAINKIKESDFLVGKNNRGWTITFDWFVLPNNFPKVLDGNYENKNGGLKHGCAGRNDTKDETDGYADAFYGAFGQ